MSRAILFLGPQVAHSSKDAQTKISEQLTRTPIFLQTMSEAVGHELVCFDVNQALLLQVKVVAQLKIWVLIQLKAWVAAQLKTWVVVRNNKNMTLTAVLIQEWAEI